MQFFENIKYNKRVKELIISVLGAIAFLFILSLPHVKSSFGKLFNSTKEIYDELILQ